MSNPEDHVETISNIATGLAGGQPILRGGVHPGQPGDVWQLKIEVAPAGPTATAGGAAAPPDAGPAAGPVDINPNPPVQGQELTSALPNLG